MRLPKIEDPTTGEPKQPVALRLVPFITQLPVEDILTWLSEPPMDGMAWCLLEAYEFEAKGNHRVGTPTLYKAILGEVKLETSFRKKLSRLPANHFVWSDELALAFSQFIDLYMSREDATASGMGLKWNVAIAPYEALIGECPDFSGQGRVRRRERKFETAARHGDWQKRVNELALKFPKLNHTRISQLVAREISGTPYERDAATIRRKTQLPRKR